MEGFLFVFSRGVIPFLIFLLGTSKQRETEAASTKKGSLLSCFQELPNNHKKNIEGVPAKKEGRLAVRALLGQQGDFGHRVKQLLGAGN